MTTVDSYMLFWSRIVTCLNQAIWFTCMLEFKKEPNPSSACVSTWSIHKQIRTMYITMYIYVYVYVLFSEYVHLTIHVSDSDLKWENITLKISDCLVWSFKIRELTKMSNWWVLQVPLVVRLINRCGPSS